MSYCIIRAAKLGNTGNLRAALEHNTRERPCERADASRTPDNKILVGTSRADDALDAHAQIVAKLVKQKNSVQAIEYVIACPPDAIERLDGPPEARNGKYLRDALAWLAERHGGAEKVIHAAIHRDEESPHIHIIVVPVAKLTRRGGNTHDTLSATQYVGGKKRLAALQTEFAEGVGKRWGLERGISKEITGRLHRPVRDWDAARVAAIEAKDLDGLSPEELKVIILRQREALQAPAIGGGRDQPTTPPPSPTSFKQGPRDWKKDYDAAFEAAMAGDRQVAAAFRQAVKQEQDRIAGMLVEKWKAEGKVDDNGMVGNRTAAQAAGRQAGEFLVDQIAGYKGASRTSGLSDVLVTLDAAVGKGSPELRRSIQGRSDRGRE